MITIPEGTILPVLTHVTANHLDKKEWWAITNAKRMYQKRGVNGAWLYYKGKYRFFKNTDYILIRR